MERLRSAHIELTVGKGHVGLLRKGLALVGSLMLACGTGVTAAPSLAPTTAGRALASPSLASTTTPAARTGATAARTATADPSRAEVVLRWDAGAIIADVDDVTDIVTHLKNTPGIVNGFGDETQITVVYEPRQITVERIRRVLADMGFPTRSPSP